MISILGDGFMAAHSTPTVMVTRLVISVARVCNDHQVVHQVNLVCGGYDGSSSLDSCEENIAGTRPWTFTTSLPRPISQLRGVTLDNRVLMTGESSKIVICVKFVLCRRLRWRPS